MDTFSQLAGDILTRFGYIGLALALVVNCMGVPIASEALLPLAGWAVRAGNLDLYLVLFIAFFAQLLGFILAYMIASHFGMPFLERYGKYVFLRQHQLAELKKLLKRSGGGIEFVGLLLPGVHGYMGYIAGFGRMTFLRFLPLLIIGTAIWTVALVALGYFAGGSFQTINNATSLIGAVVTVTIVVAALIWYSRRYRARDDRPS